MYHRGGTDILTRE